jgi:hypothetical protein
MSPEDAPVNSNINRDGTSVLPAAPGPLDYCKADAERLCPGVPMGGGRIIGCLKANKMEVSVGCAKAIQHIKAEMGK